MKKIILKCKLKSREGFERKLSDIDFDFTPIHWQHDRIYVPRGYKRGVNLPRLIMRTEMHAVDEAPKYFLILKRHIEDSGIDIVDETPVVDYANTVNIILQLGFKPAGEVSRRRQDLDMGDGTMIYLDDIDGYENEHFAKIETILQENDVVSAARDDLRKTFSTLGETDIIEKAYFEL